jgi:hypothetical protein
METVSRSRPILRIATLAAVAAVLLWAAFSAIVVPPLIESAYRNESHPVFNGMIIGRDEKPLEYYLDKWSTRACRLAVLPPLVTFCSVFAFPRWLRFARNASFHGMSTWRVGIVCSVVGCVFLGSAIDILLFREHWPFSHYPMYADLQTKWSERRSYRIFGVTDSGEEIDAYTLLPATIPLQQAEGRRIGRCYRDWETLFPPFDPARLTLALRQQEAHGTLEQATSALLSLHLRQQSDSEIVGLRLYEWRQVFGSDSDRVTKTLVFECNTADRP